jgi:SAP domain-containing protein
MGMMLRRYHARGNDGVTKSKDVAPTPEGPDAVVSEDEYTADELREQAKQLDLPTSGNKAELAARINAKLAE